jgi:hypothetical protein
MPSELEPVFAGLRLILQKHAGTFAVTDDSPRAYGLEGDPGPATLRAWGGKVRRPRIPVAWVRLGKAYVSFHLMALDGSPKLHAGMSSQLKARMQGRTCFNFKKSDEPLFQELDGITARGLAAFREAGFVADAGFA